MNKEIHLLILEDNPYDSELEIAMLEDAGFECSWKRVETQAAFLNCLQTDSFDLLIADYNLPTFDGLTALKNYLEFNLTAPFILVSGTLGEETAVEALKAGATDFVLKDRLSRLGPVVKRALRERDEQIQRIQAEQALHRSLQEIAHSQRFLLALSQAAQAVQRVHTLNEIYNTIGKEIEEIGCRTAILTLTEEDNYLEIAHLTGSTGEIALAETLSGLSIRNRFPIKNGTLCARILANQTPTFFAADDMHRFNEQYPDSEAPAQQILSALGGKQIIGAPLIVSEKSFGLLFVSGDELWETDVPAFSIFANAAAIALENAHLDQENKRQNQLLQEILDTLPEGVLLLDAEHRIRLMNPIGQRLAENLSGATVGDVLVNLGEYQLANLLEKATVDYPWQELEMADKRKFFELAIQPLESGLRADSWVLILRDVSEERERLEYQQVQERLATVGQLAAGVAHDFNNIMAVITLYSQLVLKTSNLSPKNQERLITIHTQSNRATHLIGQILDFSRRSVMERSPIELLPLLKELLKLLERTLPETIAVNLNYEPGEYGLSADPTRLQQVIMNLSVNARDAMPEGGELLIDLSHFRLRGGQKLPLPDMATGNWIKIAISDTGTGINTDHLAHIFEPFFTTKPPGQGTGLGLAQVYGIVRQHGGHINVSSQSGQGTTFTIYLPALKFASTAPLDPNVGASLPSWGKGETILVVEDNDAARDAMCDALEVLGYEALEASNGEEALRLFAERGETIALVLSDLVMPGMGGAALYKTLRKKNPDLKMIVITGYPLEEKGKKLLEMGVVAWLPKPLSGQQLAKVVAQALNE
ncbi:response regulator [Candidatus Leptofilum sp.]|uniref:response regulator n=1 Tax=Candidatus Leptofilum sp. TaxID=3241576 RepID=UPI003B5CD926